MGGKLASERLGKKQCFRKKWEEVRENWERIWEENKNNLTRQKAQKLRTKRKRVKISFEKEPPPPPPPQKK